MREQKRFASARMSAQVIQLHETTPERMQRRTSKLYFVQAGTNGPIKIGVAIDPARRVASLQIGHPEALRILKVIAGTSKHETQLHLRFWKSHLRGEWFKPTRDLLAYIETATDFDTPPPRPAKRKRKFKVVARAALTPTGGENEPSR